MGLAIAFIIVAANLIVAITIGITPDLFFAFPIAGYVMAAVLGSKGDSASKELLVFILANSERLQNGETLYYLGSPINMETRLVRYRYCFSYIIATSTRSSGLYILGSRQALRGRLMCIFSTLFAGWWGFPWGPVKTVQSIFVDTVKDGDLSDTVSGFLKRLTANTEAIFSNIVR